MPRKNTLPGQQKFRPYWWKPQSLFLFLRSLADFDSQNESTYQLFVYLVSKSIFRGAHKGNARQIPMHRELFINPNFPAHNLQWLINQGIIERDNLSLPGSKSYHYWVCPAIMQEIQKQASLKGKQDTNVYTGKQSAKQNRPTASITSLYDSNGNPIGSELVRNAIKIISNNVTPINIQRVLDYHDRLERVFLGAGGNVSERFYKQYCKVKVLIDYWMQPNINLSNGFMGYYPAYKMGEHKTGRIFEIHSGLQSSSDTLRRLALSGVAYKNFDLKASQINILYWFTKYEPLKEFAKDIYTYAATLGFPKSAVKRAIFGLLFNAGDYHNAGIFDLKLINNNETIIQALLSRFKPLTEAVKIAIEKIKAGKKTTDKYGGYWENMCGLVRTENDLLIDGENDYAELIARNKTKDPRKPWLKIINKQEYISKYIERQLLAFHIQGIESFIIHRLTTASKTYGYTVLSNQHDGLILANDEHTNKIQDSLTEIQKEIQITIEIESKDL